MKVYHKLNDMNFHLKKNKITNPEIIRLSQDKTANSGAKRYCYNNINNLDITDDINLYEIIDTNKPVRLYFDMEFNSSPELVLPIFLNKVKECFNKIFNEDLEEPLILDSGYKEEKKEHSLHYIYNTNKYFKNNIVLGGFIQEFINYVKGVNELCYTDYKGEEKFIFDTRIYTRNRSFRLPFQSKKGTGRQLQPINYNKEFDIFDFVICDYTGKKDIYEYDIEKFINNINIPVKRKKQLNKEIKRDNPRLTNILFQLKNIPKKKSRNIAIIKNKNDILLSIPNKGKFYQERYVWLFIGGLCKNIGIDIKIFNKWTADNKLKNYNIFNPYENNIKKSENILLKISSIYNQVIDIRNIKEFYDIKPKDIHKTYSAKHLKDVIEYRKETETIKDYFDRMNKPKNPDYIPYKEKDFKHFKTLLIKSGLGTGKTTQLIKSIISNKYESCVVLTPRITFARNIAKELEEKTGKPFQLYQDIKDKESFYYCDWLVIQQESLFKLYDSENKRTNTFELVCIDEVESIQTQMTSTETNKDNMGRNLDCFKYLIKNSILNLFCDGYLTYRTLNMCKDLGEEYEVIHNTYVNDKKEAIQLFKDYKEINNLDLQNFLQTEIIKKNKKMYCVITRKELLKSVDLEPFIKSGKKVKIYHGDLTEKEKKIETPNEEWIQYDLVMTTTTISVGIDFTQEHFDSGLIYGDRLCGLVRDAFQSIFRVRKLKLIYYCFNNGLGDGRKIEISKIDDKINEKVDTLRKYQILQIDKNHPDLSIFLKGMSDWSRNILLYNIYEKEINYKFYSFVFEYFLKINGFKTNNFQHTQKYKPVPLGGEFVSIDGYYNNIKVLTKEEYEKIRKKIDRTEDETKQIKKYDFGRMFNELPENLDEVFIHFKDKPKTFYNLYSEKYMNDVEVYSKKQDRLAEVRDVKFLKLEIINKLKEKFNMKNSMDDKFIIENNELEKRYKELPPRIKKNIEFHYGGGKKVVTKLNKVFKDWNDSKFIRVRNEKMIKGKRIRISNYKLQIPDLLNGIYPLISNMKTEVKCEFINED